MKILCAVDGSDFSNFVTAALGPLFHTSLREVVLLHVVDSLVLRKELKEEGTDLPQIKKVLKALDERGQGILKTYQEKFMVNVGQATTTPFVKVQPVLAHGHIVETILKYAKNRKCDMIALGSRGLSDIEGYLLGSVSRKVVAHAPCPVLAVKGPMPETCKVLLAVDASKTSRRAVQQVKKWAIPDMHAIHILSVVPPVLTDLAPEVISQSEMKALTQPIQQRAEQCVEEYRQEFLKEGFEVTFEVQTGNPREVILNQLEKRKTTLAVLGSRDLPGSARYQMGSISEWVAAYAPCSVLIVHPFSG